MISNLSNFHSYDLVQLWLSCDHYYIQKSKK